MKRLTLVSVVASAFLYVAPVHADEAAAPVAEETVKTEEAAPASDATPSKEDASKDAKEVGSEHDADKAPATTPEN